MQQISPNNDSNLVKFNKVSDFLPEGYVVYEKIYGDLNNDGLDDCVVIIKGQIKKTL